MMDCSFSFVECARFRRWFFFFFIYEIVKGIHVVMRGDMVVERCKRIE